MKILTKEEEAAHYSAAITGGVKGLALGLGIGLAGLAIANRKIPLIRNLTVPMKAFLITSSSTFGGIVAADRASRTYEFDRQPIRLYQDSASKDKDILEANKSDFQKFMDWGRKNRYPIVTVSWIASMATAFQLVRRNKFLTGAQKLVQARVYAQGLTLAVLIVTALFEVGDANKGRGRWETVMILDPDDPEHKHLIEKRIHHQMYEGEDLWKDMVAAEERKIAARKDAEEKAAKA